MGMKYLYFLIGVAAAERMTDFECDDLSDSSNQSATNEWAHSIFLNVFIGGSMFAIFVMILPLIPLCLRRLESQKSALGGIAILAGLYCIVHPAYIGYSQSPDLVDYVLADCIERYCNRIDAHMPRDQLACQKRFKYPTIDHPIMMVADHPLMMAEGDDTGTADTGTADTGTADTADSGTADTADSGTADTGDGSNTPVVPPPDRSYNDDENKETTQQETHRMRHETNKEHAQHELLESGMRSAGVKAAYLNAGGIFPALCGLAAVVFGFKALTSKPEPRSLTATLNADLPGQSAGGDTELGGRS